MKTWISLSIHISKVFGRMAELSKTEFIHFLMEKLSLGDAERSSWTVDEQNFALKNGGHVFSLTGNYEKCAGLKDASEREKHFQQVAGILRSVASSPPTGLDSAFDSVKDMIFPRIRETEYVKEVNDEEKNAGEKMVAVSTNILPGTLSVVFILDINGSLTTEVKQRHIDAWKQTAQQLFDLSLENLKKKTPVPLKWTRVDGGFEPTIEDEHVAARCLLADAFATSKPQDTMGGDQIIIIPADDHLLATFSMDQLGLCFLGDTLLDYENDADADNTITQQPLRLQTTPTCRWAPFEPKENEGRIPTDEKDVEMLFNAIKLASQKFAVEQLGGVAANSCAACGKAGVSLSKCSRCLSVEYCSRDCQKSHWSTHKKSCAQK